MENYQHRVLILEDVPVDAELMTAELRRGGLVFESQRVETREDFLSALNTFKPDIILSDYNLPQFDGLAALEIVRERLPNIPFIFVSGVMGDELAVATLKSGATDYILKDKLIRLAPAVDRAFQEVADRNNLNKRVAELESLISSVVGRELKMVELKKTIAELKEQIAALPNQ